MSRHLGISVTFLDPLFHGQGDDNRPEWPPSPLRLFQALLAGSRTGCRNNEWSDEKANAFRWLEKQSPPVIVAPVEQLMSARRFFVPDNHVYEKWERQEHLTPKVAHPHHLCDGDTVHYLWPLDDGDGTAQEAHAALLCREARHLLALGWGIDQVVGNGRILTDTEAAALPGRRWRPSTVTQAGGRSWRIPVCGSLHDLETVHVAFLRRVDRRHYRGRLRLTRFDTVTYHSALTLPPRRYAVFELPEGVAFRQENAACVAAMLRSLACRCARQDNKHFDGGSETYVAGHTGRREETPPRFSYLPLPSIGHPHADGMIRRVLIAEPYGGSGAHARWARNRLLTQALRDKDNKERGDLLDFWRSTSRALLERYVGDDEAWCTVTPVVLPGHDDGKLAKAEKLLLAAVRQAGLPPDALSDVTMRKAPFWPGSQHPRCYFLPDYLRQFPGWHVRVVFREALPGPLAVGAGRHSGLGLFARCEG